MLEGDGGHRRWLELVDGREVKKGIEESSSERVREGGENEKDGGENGQGSSGMSWRNMAIGSKADGPNQLL